MCSKKIKKEPIIKIKSWDGEKNINSKKKLNKNNNNLKSHDNYNIQDFILSYDSKAKIKKNNFDKYGENKIKLLFRKRVYMPMIYKKNKTIW